MICLSTMWKNAIHALFRLHELGSCCHIVMVLAVMLLFDKVLCRDDAVL